MEESKKKTRFCKYCGHEINPETKKCSGCGKQYFSFKQTFSPICVVLLIASIAVNIYMGISLSDYKYNYEITKLHYEDAKEQVESYRNKAAYLDRNVVFTTDTGEKYHKYDCWHLNGNHKNMWSIYNAERAGYEECLDCH